VLGLAVIFAMFTVGSLTATAFSTLDFRYARYDASWRSGLRE